MSSNVWQTTVWIKSWLITVKSVTSPPPLKKLDPSELSLASQGVHTFPQGVTVQFPFANSTLFTLRLRFGVGLRSWVWFRFRIWFRLWFSTITFRWQRGIYMAVLVQMKWMNHSLHSHWWYPEVSLATEEANQDYAASGHTSRQGNHLDKGWLWFDVFGFGSLVGSSSWPLWHQDSHGIPLDMVRAKARTACVASLSPHVGTSPRPSPQLDISSWSICNCTGSCITSALFVLLLLPAPVLKTGTGWPPPDNPPLQLASVVLVAAEQLQWGFYNPCQRVGKTASLQYSRLEYFYRPTEPQASICPTVLQTVLHASLVQSSVFCSDIQPSHCTGDDRQWCSVCEFPGVFICPSWGETS